MKLSLLSSTSLAAVAGLFVTSSAHSAVVFEASASNTTEFSNTAANTDSFTVTGDTATGTLLMNNENGDFNNSGIVSTSTIAGLNGSSLTALDTVTMTLTVDSITGAIRANGSTFGISGDTAFGSDLGINVRANNATILPIISAGFGTFDTFTSFSVTEASIKDGYTITLTADVNGFTFSFSDLIASGANPIVDVTGTFSGTEFVDAFGTSHLYTSTQKFNQGAAPTDTTISVASIDIASVPEPSSFALIGLGSLGLLLKRRRA